MKNVTLQTVSLTGSLCLKATQHAILKQRGLFLISTQRDLFWLGEIGWHGNQYCVVHLMQPYLFSTLSAGRGKGGLCLCVCCLLCTCLCVCLLVCVLNTNTLSQCVEHNNSSSSWSKLLLCARPKNAVWNESERTENKKSKATACSVGVFSLARLWFCRNHMSR